MKDNGSDGEWLMWTDLIKQAEFSPKMKPQEILV